MNDTRSRIKSEYTSKRIEFVQCPSCRGQGVFRGGPERDMPWQECVWCKGEGEISEEDALAFGDEP